MFQLGKEVDPVPAGLDRLGSNPKKMEFLFRGIVPATIPHH